MIPISDRETPNSGTPYVNVAFIAINVLVFLYSLTVGNQSEFFLRFGVLPAEFTTGQELTGTGRIGNELVNLTSPIPTWATLVTSMFIHGGFMHLAGNMVFLWVFGDNVEGRLGHAGYAAFYLACGLAASGTHIAFSWDSLVPTVGASGAVAGVMGAYLLYYPYHRVKTLVIFIFISVMDIPAVYLIGFWALLQLFSGVGSIGMSAQSGGVAYWAHIGGLAAGAGFVAASRLVRGQSVWQPDRPRNYRFFR
ncbi:MAG: rhomboid family intramembrane serine protease [Chloroflexi bacterium]|nr:rhomboid family intramembrane serine protease [Chloroflexota bacterium]